MNPVIISDGGTGAIIVWQDRRGGFFDIYIQKIDASGAVLWTVDGVPVCQAANDESDPRLISDGAGGAIVTWEDARPSISFDVFAQRIDASGTPMWATDGIPICDMNGNQQNPTIVSDDAGGAIIVWQDVRNGPADIWAQRVDADGDTLWQANGVEICAAPRAQLNPVAIASGAGGAIACWVDRRGAGLGDIYARLVDANGVVQWTANGVALCTNEFDQSVPVLVSDGAGGAIAAWADARSGTRDIFARRVDNAGIALWTVDGVAVCDLADDQNNPAIVGDAMGGAIVAWEDNRDAASYDIYAGHIDGNGIQSWTAGGVALCTAPLNQVEPAITTDASNGAIVAWQDHRANFHANIFARRVNASGSPQWDANGVYVCGALGDQFDPVTVFSDAGAAIVAWEDLRTGTYDIYAQLAMGSPTAVAILSFEAVQNAAQVTLRAEFRSDLGVEGVNVYRGDARGSLQRIDHVAGTGEDAFEYVDRGVSPGQTYRYQIGAIDADGEFLSPIVAVAVSALVGTLDQNRPNPFNPSTAIRFVIPERSRVSVGVYDAGGRIVRTLVDDTRDAGEHEIVWDGRDDRGVSQSSGVYFYRMQAGKQVESRKMVLLK
jgi:hypothetical protein